MHPHFFLVACDGLTIRAVEFTRTFEGILFAMDCYSGNTTVGFDNRVATFSRIFGFEILKLHSAIANGSSSWTTCSIVALTIGSAIAVSIGVRSKPCLPPDTA